MVGAVRRLATTKAVDLATARAERLFAAWAALERTQQGLRAEAVDLAFDLAARVAGETVRADRGVVRSALGEACARLGPVSALLVRAHVDEVVTCREALQGSPFAFEVVADPTVSAGGVVIESTRGVVDARIEVRLARLRGLLAEAR